MTFSGSGKVISASKVGTNKWSLTIEVEAPETSEPILDDENGEPKQIGTKRIRPNLGELKGGYASVSASSPTKS